MRVRAHFALVLRLLLNAYYMALSAPADTVNGLKQLQYTVLMSGKSVAFEVDVAVGVLATGTCWAFELVHMCVCVCMHAVHHTST